MQNLPKLSLLSEYRTVLRYASKNDFIYVRKESMAFMAHIVMQLTNAEKYNIQTYLMRNITQIGQ